MPRWGSHRPRLPRRRGRQRQGPLRPVGTHRDKPADHWGRPRPGAEIDQLTIAARYRQALRLFKAADRGRPHRPARHHARRHGHRAERPQHALGPLAGGKSCRPRAPARHRFDAELQRALDDPDPLRGIAHLVARSSAAFVLDLTGVTRTKALGTERMARRLHDALSRRRESAARRRLGVPATDARRSSRNSTATPS
jgi:hypothetical protein